MQGFFAFSQEVNKEFTKLLLSETFDRVEENWSSTFNADNLFIAQNGYYELYRKSKKSGYFVFSNSEEEYSSFQLETQIVFSEHKNKKQSAGVLMMAKKETGGGLLVEINQKREYRIVRVYKDKQVPLNGSNSGWVKASNVITKVENSISIKTYDKVYDLYINGMYIQSFTDIELNKGKIGIYVGPDSKVKFDYLKLLGEDKKELQDIVPDGEKSIEQSFTQIIVKLKDQINKKDKDIDDLKTRLKLCETSGQSGVRQADTGIVNQRNKLMMQVVELEAENEDLRIKLEDAEYEMTQLKNFKATVEKSNEEGDIVINLTNMVSTQKQTIETLERDKKVLNNENNSLFIETKELTKSLDIKTNENSYLKEDNQKKQLELDSLKRLVMNLKDSLNGVKIEKSQVRDENGKVLTEEERLQRMIEKEREERRKRKEEEERQKQEENKTEED
jgi:hypothetical protein